MSSRILPLMEMHDRKGAVAIISSGDLPDFPPWFEKEMVVILDRLRAEALALPVPPKQTKETT